MRGGSVGWMRVAALQFESSKDPARLRSEAEALVRQAAREDVDLMVLPEATQRPFGTSATTLATKPEAVDGPFVEWLIEQASLSGAVVIAGMFEASAAGGLPFNTTVAVGPNGLLAVYRKIHLYDALGFEESRGLSAGPTTEENFCVVEVQGVPVGIMTCFDVRFPEMARSLVMRGARVIALGAAWVPGPHKIEQWRALLQARAIESTSFVIAAAQPGERYCGHSAIISPEGVVLAEAGGSSSGVLIEDLSITSLDRVREGMPVLAQRRLGLEWPR